MVVAQIRQAPGPLTTSNDYLFFSSPLPSLVQLTLDSLGLKSLGLESLGLKPQGFQPLGLEPPSKTY